MSRPFLIVLFAAVCPLAAVDDVRAPVLVELFTSEGCSSCPPADQLLAKLDSHAVVLGEHVDYWDHQGWRDSFSSPAFTQRQEAYSRQFHLESVYTPEMVVDGTAEFSGADARRAQAEIAQAAQRRKAKVQITRTASGVEIAVEDAPRSADVYLALADDHAASQVGAGENKGRHLQHVSIARSIRKIGSVRRAAGFRKVVELAPGSGAQRIVVFVQDGTGAVSGASVLAPAT